LKFTPFVQHDRIGVFGFCAGGANTWDLVVNVPELAAAVPFYGAPPPIAALQDLQTPILAIYGERDRNLTAQMAPVMTELLARQKVFGFQVFEGAAHAFYNDTGANYNAEAACKAWAETVAFLNKFLRR
jgi:carboxymethylenebutenolidase